MAVFFPCLILGILAELPQQSGGDQNSANTDELNNFSIETLKEIMLD